MRRWFVSVVLFVVLMPVMIFAQVPPQVLDQIQQKTSAQVSATTKPTTAPTTQATTFMDILTGSQTEIRPDQLLKPELWVQFIQETIYWAVGFIPRLLTAIFLLIFFYLIYRFVRKMVLGGMKAAGVDESIRDMLGMLIKWGILGFGLIIAGNQIGIQIAALLTGVSIIGLAIGFAAQESLSNFIAGIMIFWDKPFKVGDWIEVDSHLGQVKRVTFRSTRLIDLDGDTIIYPNMRMLSDKVINKSSNDITRCSVPIGIAYKENIDAARKVLLDMVGRDSRIEKVPTPKVVVVNLNSSSVDLMLRFWIKEEAYENAMVYEYLEKAKKSLDEAGIQIPYPHTQVILDNSPALEAIISKRI